MKKILITLIAGFILNVICYGQGIIRGKVTDENGEPLTAVTIAIRSLGLVAFADFDGKFTLKIPDSKSQIVSLAFIGYQTIEDTISLSDNEVLAKDYNMLPVTKSINEVVVTGHAKKANDTYMTLLKAKSATSIDFISSETIKKTGDSQTTDAIKRITGVSTVGGYISVRGLADRYIKTSVNGMRIPTLDPLTNNIKLDMFPTSLVDNIIITKTASPDLPGDWAGSYVSIETKDYPDKLTISINTTLGYNAQTTFKNIISSSHSKTDWLGYDNGYRETSKAGYNGTYPEPYGTKVGQTSITPYDEFAALGLQEYMDQMGYNKNNLGISSMQNNSIEYKMCLIKLGLLSPGYVDNPEAISEAKNRFENEYSDSAYTILNTPASEFGQSMPTNWGYIKRKAPLNFSQEVSIGNQTELFKRPLGFLLGLRYSSATRYDGNAEFMLTSAPEPGDSLYFNVRNRYIKNRQNLQFSTETNGWSALINLAYAITPNHSVTLLFMPNLTGLNYCRTGIKVISEPSNASTDSITYSISQYYEERKQLIYQLHSNHFFPSSNIRINIHASYTDGSSSIPDTKTFKLAHTNDIGNYFLGSQEYLHKKSSYLVENIYDTWFSAEMPIGDSPGLIRKVKAGGGYQYSLRINDNYIFNIPFDNISINSMDEVNNSITQDNFKINNNFLRSYYYYEIDPANFVIGESKITSGYFLIDYALGPAFRCSGGARMEHTDLYGDIRLFHELGLQNNDTLRLKTKIVAPGREGFINGKPGRIARYDYLPSLSVIYRIKNSDNLVINSRLNFSQTLARPSLREITNLTQDDFIINKETQGNPELKIVEINNYDVRFESFFKDDNNLSISFFYKNFRNHIEMIENAALTWANAEFAEAYGLEIEGQKKLPWGFDFRGNFTLIRSGSRTVIGTNIYKHAMFGQAPYIVNAILSYKFDPLGISASMSFNIQGRKLAIVSIKSSEKETSDVFEMPQPILDFKLSKTLGKHFIATFKARNILNAPIRRSYIYKHIGEIDYSNYTYGTDYSLGLSYNF